MEMSKSIQLIKESLKSVNWGLKKVEHWKDGLFTVTPNAGSDITLSVHEFESYYVVSLFSTSCFRTRPFSSCWLSKGGEVIHLDGAE